jgi:hypothetical protein
MADKKYNEKIQTIWKAENMCCIILTPWESKFLFSLETQVENKGEGSVTWKQSKCINSIYSRIE